MSRAWRVLAGALAAGAVVALAAPAYAAPEGRIVGVQSKNGSVDVVFEGRELPASTQLDPATVTMSVNGKQLRASGKRLGDAGTISRATILTLDVSGSMNQGSKLANAKRAAEVFLDAAPADVLVGLVTFNDSPRLLVAPTSDRNRVRAAVRGLQAPPKGTALYDAVKLSLKALGSDGVRSVVLLSDGEEDGSSRAKLSDTVAAVRDSKAVLDVVAVEAAKALPALRRLAGASGGHVVATAQASDLTGLFEKQARELGRQVLVNAKLPPGTPAGSATITVTGRAGSATLTDSAEVLLSAVPVSAADIKAAGPVPAPTGTGFINSQETIVAAILMLFVGFAAVLIIALNGLASAASDSGVKRRLSIYTLSGRRGAKEQDATALGQNAVARSAVELAGKVVARRGLEDSLGRKLEAGGVHMKPAEWIIVHAGVAILLPLFLFMLTGGNLLRASLGLAAGVAAPYFYLSFMGRRRKRKFVAMLPDTLQLMAGSLEAGYSLPQAVDTVAREAEDPVASEFNRAIVESRLGVPVDEALDNIATRMDCRDFAWVVMAIRIQREVGGNLAEILKNVAATLRERERLRRQVLVLSAEVIGIIWMRRIVDVEV